MNNDRPEYGTPEFDIWIREQARKDAEDFSKIEMTEEEEKLIGVGRMFGPEKEAMTIEKIIAENEKRKHLKVIE